MANIDDGLPKREGNYRHGQGNADPEDMDLSAFRVTRDVSKGAPGQPRVHEYTNLRTEVVKKNLLVYLLQGYSLKEAAKAAQVRYQQARKVMQDPDALAELKVLSETIYRQLTDEVIDRRVSAHQRLLEMSDAALTRLEELIEAENEHVALKAVQDVLDRHGEVPRQQKTIGEHKHLHIDAATLAAAAQAAQELLGPRKEQLLIEPESQDKDNERGQ